MASERLSALTKQLKNGEDLSSDLAQSAAHALADTAVDAEEKKAFLTALGAKGETAMEVGAFARVFRGLALDPGLEAFAADAIDVCGTGGDGSGSFNVSTAVAFCLASLGIPVIKHGNRSITSKCGSADLIEACGFPISASPELTKASLEALNFTFLFAPNYHPAFKSIAPVRKALAEEGKRSVFNLLGPLINPARPAHQLLGVFSPDWVPRLAGALDELGLTSAAVVHSVLDDAGGLDELSTFGENHLDGAGNLRGKGARFRAADLGMPSGSPQDLSGGDAVENKRILEQLFRCDPAAPPPPEGLLNCVALNAGAALWVLGKAENIASGCRTIRDHLASGAAAAWLARANEFFSSESAG